MHGRRLLGIAAVAVTAMTLTSMPVARATLADAHTAEATGVGLRLSLLGQEVAVARSWVAHSSWISSAVGTAVSLPPFEVARTAAHMADASMDEETDERCADLRDVPIAVRGEGCTSAWAYGRMHLMSEATSSARVVVGSQLLDGSVRRTLEDQLGGVLGGLGLGTRLGAALTESGTDPAIDAVVDALAAGAPLLTATLGTVAAEARTSPFGVHMAACRAGDSRIELLDAPGDGQADPPPALSIAVGASTTRAHASTNELSSPSATGQASPVTVRSPFLPGGEAAVPAGETVTIPMPEPLGPSVISVSAAATDVDEGAAAALAHSGSVRLRLLDGSAIPGGIHLELASCSSAVRFPTG